MKRIIVFIESFFTSVIIFASATDSLLLRLQRFGQLIPQEKVYVHMDNTCYWLGDTIWFAAYTRQTNNGMPSQISRVLYVELFNQDGYLMERQLIEMNDGRGHGNFVLSPSFYYGGFYELRAYTRWQLNWGCYEHPHSRVAKEWFINEEKEHQYYRDYERLYSRVFPVYDYPTDAGVYEHAFTLRPVRRYFKKKEGKPDFHLALYPEGGMLVEGLPCRIAFEAARNDGEYLDGTLMIGGSKAHTVHRGRGIIEITPKCGDNQKAMFVCSNGETVSISLPAVKERGISINVTQSNYGRNVCITASEAMNPEELCVTLMHEGLLLHHYTLTGSSSSIVLVDSLLPAGVNQITVFDSYGHVWADRLFFVNHGKSHSSRLQLQGLKGKYVPFEEIQLEVQSDTTLKKA